jgi:hypothetical protein
MDALRYALYNTAPIEDDSALRMKILRNRMGSKSMA